MSQSFRPIDRFAENWARATIRFRWLVLFGALLAALATGSGARHLEFSNNYRVFFSQENPELAAFENLQSTYTRNDNFLFVLEPADGQVFSTATLSAIEALTNEAWKIPYAIRVDSLSNFQHSYARDDNLVVEDLVREAGQLSALQREEVQRIALAEPLLRGQLVTPDANAAAVNVILQYPEKSLTEVPEAVAHARALRDRIAIEYPHLAISLTGVSMLNNAFAEAGFGDLSTLVPTMFAVILALTLFILRSVSATFATLAVIALSTAVGLGLAGFAGIKLSPISAAAPIVILTLAIADSIHILVSLRHAIAKRPEKTRALVEAIRLNFLPVSITSLTTIIGFAALNFSDSPPFRHLGNITAAGIGAAWIFSVTLLPALIAILPYRPRASRRAGAGHRALTRVADFVIARPRQILLTLGAAVLTLGAMIPRIEFNDEWTRYFDQRIEFRRDTDRALEHFGMYPIEFSVPAQTAGGISAPEYQMHLERFTEFLRAQPEVVHVYSLSDVLKRLNKNLHGDNPQYHRIPQDRDQAAQYLLLYELSLPYGLDLNDRINIDKSATRVTATLGEADSIETRRFLSAARAWMAENLPEWMQAKPTSAAVMFTHIAQRNVDNMIVGTIVAIAAIAVVLMAALRSIPMGLISLVPNALPILATFGAWALLVGNVGFSVAAVASISLGIIVDDTVHLLAKYVRARRERQLDAAGAIRFAFQNVGPAVAINTLILVSGFAVLVTSSFKVNVDMGLLTAIAIVFALVLDLLFLPALLLVLDRAGPNHAKEGVIVMSASDSLARSARSLTAPAVAIMVLGAGLASFAPLPASASTAALTPVRGATDLERRGFTIAAQADRSDRGFGDSEVELEMVLRNAAGQESRRRLRIVTLEIGDETLGDKSLVVFDEPRDIKGTALLSHAQILDPDNQWLFLPSLKRIKRISSANKSGPFVGSEFAFEDFTSLELNKYEYTWLAEDRYEGMAVDVIERRPRYENSGYTRQISWVDREVHQIRKVEFYDRRGELLKTLSLHEYKEYDGVWRSHQMKMVNHQTGKSTDLIYGEYRFGVGLSDRDFDKGRLAQIR